MASNPISRRDVVTQLGAGLAGAALVSAVPAAEAQNTCSTATAAPFVDPTTEYPKPPYHPNRSHGPASPAR